PVAVSKNSPNFHLASHSADFLICFSAFLLPFCIPGKRILFSNSSSERQVLLRQRPSLVFFRKPCRRAKPHKHWFKPTFQTVPLPPPARFENRTNPCKHWLGTFARLIPFPGPKRKRWRTNRLTSSIMWSACNTAPSASK